MVTAGSGASVGGGVGLTLHKAQCVVGGPGFLLWDVQRRCAGFKICLTEESSLLHAYES